MTADKPVLLAVEMSRVFHGELPQPGCEQIWVDSALEVFAKDAEDGVRELFASELTYAIRALRCQRDTEFVN